MKNIKHKHREEVQLFVNKELELEVRAVEINGKGWLVGKDIAQALGYSNTAKAIRDHIDIEDKLSERIVLSGQKREVILINESGFYSLILRSDMPKAKQFKRWVTTEVLPQIRKTGGYISINENDDLNNKNRFINQLAASENTLLVREVAKVASKADVVIGEKKLWTKLREWGFIFKNSTEPKQCGIDRGYFEVNEGTKEARGKIFTYRTTRVTGKGQAYIIERLLKEVVA